MSEYSYNKPNINFKKLDVELENANLFSLIDYYEKVGSSITFFTFSNLTAPQESSLSSIVSAHEPNLNYESNSLTQSQTNSTQFQTKLSVTELTKNKKYYLNWYYEFRISSTSQDFQGQVRVNGSSIAEINVEAKDTRSYYPHSGRIPIELPEGETTIDIRYSSENGSTVFIRNAYLYLEEA